MRSYRLDEPAAAGGGAPPEWLPAPRFAYLTGDSFCHPDFDFAHLDDVVAAMSAVFPGGLVVLGNLGNRYNDDRRAMMAKRAESFLGWLDGVAASAPGNVAVWREVGPG